MPAPKNSPMIVFVAMLVLAVVLIVSIANSSKKPREANAQNPVQPPALADSTPPETAPPELAPDPGVNESPAPVTIEQGTLTDGAVPTGETPARPATLTEAAAAGDLDALGPMLIAGVDVNQRDESGRTALMAAAEGGHVEVVFALLDAGADPSIRDLNRRAARDHALMRGDDTGRTIARVLADAVGAGTIEPPTDK